MSNPLQKAIDEFWNKTLFKIIPKFVTPNYFTFLRFFLIPVVLCFMAIQWFGMALLIFLLAALADSIDGSLARIRKQISEYGTMLDPMADKFLIVLSSLFLFFYYPYVSLLLIVIIIDVLIGMEGLVLMIMKRDLETPPSNWTGKSKMVFQVASILIIMFYLMTSSVVLLDISVIILYLSIFTGVLSFFSYGWRAYKILKM